MPAPFPIPLQNSPQLVQAGLGVHGREGKATIEQYQLPHLWCIHLYEYDAVMEIDGVAWDIKPGSVSLVPPGRKLTYHYPDVCRHRYAHFSLTPSANLGNSTTAKSWYEPDEITEDFRRAMETIAQPQRGILGVSKLRAEAALWEMLWRLWESTPQQVTADELHPCLQKAMVLVETRMGASISVAELAHEVGLSHNQLTRLFVAHTGQTVVAYIRAARALRAKYLLQNSTLPIPSIAAQIGTPDLGQFNHLMRRETGQSPRALRAANSS